MILTRNIYYISSEKLFRQYFLFCQGFIQRSKSCYYILFYTNCYELKTAVGTSVFIMTFTALTGSVSHFMMGTQPDITSLIFCILSTLLFARIAAIFANKASPKVLNRATGIVLAILGAAILFFNLLK